LQQNCHPVVVDALEATTAELEANQFSTTTKLTGKSSLLLLMSLVMKRLVERLRS